jgi:hypothetical protein
MGRVWASAPAEGRELLLLLALADNANDDGGECWPSHRTLAKKCRCSVRHVKRLLATLAERDLITIGVQQGGHDRTPDALRPNSYTLNFASMTEDGQTPGDTETPGDVDDRRTWGSEPGDTAMSTPGDTQMSPERPERPEPSADERIKRGIASAARRTGQSRARLTRTWQKKLEGWCERWPAISADQLAEGIVQGGPPRSVAYLTVVEDDEAPGGAA